MLAFRIFRFFDPLFGQKSIFGFGGVKFFITNLDHLLALNYLENLSSIRLGWVLGWFRFFLPPFWPKIDFWLGRGSKFSSPTLIICWAWTTLKIWDQLDLWLRLWILFAGRGWGQDGMGWLVIIKTISAQAFAWLGLAWLGFGLGWGLST